MAISVLCERSDMNKHVEDARYYLKRASETAGKGLKEALEPVAARFRALTAEAEPEPSRLVALKADVNYPTLPRSGLLAPRLLGVGLSVSASALASSVDTAVPDSAGGFPSRVVWSVPLLPDGHSTTTDSARFLSRLNTVGDVVSIVLLRLAAVVVSVAENVFANRAGAVSPPCSRLRRSLRKGA